jgi:hypothetical protein
MKNKFDFILLGLLILNSCNQNARDNRIIKDIVLIDNNNINKNTEITTYNKCLKIIGKWSMPYTKSGNSTIHCNTCKSIVFEKKIAKIMAHYGEIEIERYNYIIKNDTIFFSNVNNSSKDMTFSDERFLMNFDDKHEFCELELRQIDKKYSYILRK